MAPLIVSPGFTITVRRLGLGLPIAAMLKLTSTIEALREEWPALPGPEDERRPRPPTGQCWSRAVRETSLVVLYLSGREGVTVLAVKSAE